MRIDLSLKERPDEPSDDRRNENPEEEKKYKQHPEYIVEHPLAPML